MNLQEIFQSFDKDAYAAAIEAEAERDGWAIRQAPRSYHGYKTKAQMKRKIVRGTIGADGRKGMIEVPK